MRRLNLWVSCILGVVSRSHAVVLVTDIMEPTVFWNSSSLIPIEQRLDIDNNGTIDFILSASIFTSVDIRTERANRVVISPSPPPNIGGPVSSLADGFEISSNLFNSDHRWTSTDLVDGFVDGSETSAFSPIIIFLSSGVGTDFDEHGAIGIEFEAADGIHYGYIDISRPDRDRQGIILNGWAYETEPNKGIVIGSIPEPSSSLLTLLGLSVLYGRRR